MLWGTAPDIIKVFNGPHHNSNLCISCVSIVYQICQLIATSFWLYIYRFPVNPSKLVLPNLLHTSVGDLKSTERQV